MFKTNLYYRKRTAPIILMLDPNNLNYYVIESAAPLAVYVCINLDFEFKLDKFSASTSIFYSLAIFSACSKRKLFPSLTEHWVGNSNG